MALSSLRTAPPSRAAVAVRLDRVWRGVVCRDAAPSHPAGVQAGEGDECIRALHGHALEGVDWGRADDRANAGDCATRVNFSSVELETAVRLKCNLVHVIWRDVARFRAEQVLTLDHIDGFRESYGSTRWCAADK